MTSQSTEDQFHIIDDKSGIYRYIPHKEIKIFKSLGWKVVSNMEGSHHARHAVIMKKPDTEKEET